MKLPIRKSEDALNDIEDQIAYIAQSNVKAARRFVEDFEQTADLLARFPEIGSPRDYGNPKLAGMRMRPIRGFEKILIFYIPTTDAIDIVRVLHSARNIAGILGYQE